MGMYAAANGGIMPAMVDPLLDAQARLALMREATSRFVGSAGAGDAAQRLADLVVPRFADWCSVIRRGADGAMVTMAVAHADPDKVALALELQRRWPPDPEATAGAPEVLRTGQPELVPEILPDQLEAAAHDPEHLAALRALGLRSYVAMPLTADDEVVGVLTLVHAESKRQFVPAQLDGLWDLASLAAMALHHSLLADRLRDVLDASEKRADSLANVLDNLPTLAWSARPDGHIDQYNQSWFEYTGTTFDEMQGWGWESLHDPELLGEVKRRWNESLQTGEPFEMEFTLRGADGIARWFLTRIRPLRDDDGTIVRWIGTNTDIDDLKRSAALVEMVKEQNELVEGTLRAL